METPSKRLNEIRRKSETNNLPSEAELRFVSNHLVTHPVKGRLRKLLAIPTKERINLRFVRGSRHSMEAMPIANLRLLNKHRNLFPKDSLLIHETLLNRENPARRRALNNAFGRLTPSERIRFTSIPVNTVPVERLSTNNIKFLNEHRNLFPQVIANRIRAEHVKRTDPLTPAMKESIQTLARNWAAHTRAQQVKHLNELTAKATKGNLKIARWETTAAAARERTEGVKRTPQPKMLNWNKPKNYFKSTLEFKSINNANVQNVIKKLKAYRNEHQPTKNNMPARPNRPTKLENRQKYKNNMREYDQAIRQWILYMANIRRQNRR